MRYDYGRFLSGLDRLEKGHGMVIDIYQATRVFPRDELYGLTNQLRRAAVSVLSNIAEGQARFPSKESHHFLSHAQGSLVEIETQHIIAQNLGYLGPAQSNKLLQQSAELGRVLNGLIGSIKRSGPCVSVHWRVAKSNRISFRESDESGARNRPSRDQRGPNDPFDRGTREVFRDVTSQI